MSLSLCPCGLRAAIECALLGSRVVVLEQRDKFSRNNVLHLWEFVIADLKGLGAKFFYPKFCTGSIEHISIRQLQCILLKVSLLFGVQVYDSVSFKQLLLPTEDTPIQGNGYRALLDPSDHILSTYEFDVLIGADGKRNTVPGFPREEMRGKLAIGITANFINKKSYEEERVPEISGVAYIFNQSFFKEMYEVTGVDLENIVYYKDETHYFVMCAKKSCLLEQKVIKKDMEDVSSLLSSSNVDEAALCRFAAAAADFATKSKLPSLEFATNQRSRPDVALFDFTSLFSSKCSVRMVKKAGRSLLLAIVGDSLHEPFWPTGSGCARGFLGVWDTAWLIRQLSVSGRDEMELMAERESVYRLLAQVTKDNMHKNMTKYTIDPRTRYVSLDLNVKTEDVKMLVWGDEGQCAPLGAFTPSSPSSLWHLLSCHRFAFHSLAPYKFKMHNLASCWRDGRALGAIIAKFIPDSLDYLKLLAMEEEEARIKHCLSVIVDRLCLQIPSGEWKEVRDDVIIAFVANLITWIRSDDERAKKAITPKVMSLKRKNDRAPVDASKARKAAPIERLAKDVMACYANGNGERKTEVTPSRLGYRTALVPPMRNETKRPLVERLNPLLVFKVEQIVTGEKVKEDERLFYKERVLQQEKAAHRMNREELVKMEERMAAIDRGEGKEKRENMSGQEEKLMRARVSDVRKEAEEGFMRREEKEKYKEVDESLRRSDQRLKQKELAGLPSIRAKPSLPPTPPKKTMTIDSSEEGQVKMRKLETPSSTRRLASLSMVEPAKNACAYCIKPVYLAEKMVVEGLTLHKTCFKCAFCAQALRLGDCSVERQLDQYKAFRMFCKIHSRLPLRDKLAKIERTEKKEKVILEKANSMDNVDIRDTHSHSQHESTPLSPRRHTVTVDATTPTIKEKKDEMKNGERKLPTRGSSSSLFFFPCDNGSSIISSTTSSKDLTTTITIGDEKDGSIHNGCVGRSRDDLLTPLRASMLGKENEEGRDISEKAEFATLERSLIRKVSPSSSMDEDEDDDEEETEIDILETAIYEGEDVEIEEEDEEEELGEEEMEELERTVAELEDSAEDGVCTERQALSIIETINRRRGTGEGRESDDGRRRSRTVDEGELRERKEEELNERKKEARERARAKSDHQLGLEKSDRNNVSPSSSSTPFATPSASSTSVTSRIPAATVTPSLSHLPPLSTASVYSTPPSRPAPYSPPQGLLARLFSPSSSRRPFPSPFNDKKGEAKKKESHGSQSGATESVDDPMSSSFVDADVVNVESAKENELKGKSYRKMKHLRSTDSRGEMEMNEERKEESSGEECRGQTTPMAIVAPNPRSIDSDSASRLSTDDASIRMVQRKVERMRRQRADDRRRTGQDIQRGMAECEIRIEEVMREGTAAERRLCGDPTCTHLLETWYSLVMERDRLRDREDDLRLRAREIAADEEYKSLKKRFNEMSLDGGDEDEDTLLEEMVEALRKRGSARAAVESYRDTSSRPRRDPPHVVLQRHGYNYLNFRPIFIA
ncbi:hypothetical protein PRIPAC_88443 [Pristionchus pacificus]|uniref:LIM zinc-binding domain-containing protein n=1 Tax=Pristionchus pacificus TaxID=54126 RepID=A0A2A6CIZ3_PRIPA|nr:hypothetical protein PRIPAC_88443 [Pristionchus pacificus]|eukprot:PDM78070.1 hypothetical protein PRIPAC_30455 [Pristionchus pacificus]